jgi:glycosyltransferase involved in cell wall biosynthesis
MLRIGINGADLEGRGTGVKRYLSSILPYLECDNSQYFIYSRAPLPEELIPKKKCFIRRPTGHPVDKSYTFWEQFVLPQRMKKDSIDIFLSAGYSIPLMMKIPSIVVIHDLSFSAHPEWYGWKEGLRRRLITRMSARRARRIITVSQFSKMELVNRYRIPDEKITIASNAVSVSIGNLELKQPAKKRVRQKYNLGSPVILYVGLLLERRYIRQLIEAFGIVRKYHKNATLVLIGKNQLNPNTSVSELAHTASVGDSVLHLEYVADTELTELYGTAEVFVYLSSYEGFGIPPLEALSAGVPVVTSRSSALEEIYSGSALLVEDHTPEEIAGKINLLLIDKKLRSGLLNSGKNLTKKFSWKKTAEIINHEIKDLAERL